MSRADDRARAFDELYAENFTDVWSFVRRRVASTADADDVTAEVFTTAWRRFDGLPARQERRLWLFGVARNVVRNHRRSERRRSRLAARVIAIDAPRAGGDPAERPTNRMAVAFDSLAEEDRELLIMRAWDQLAVGDIAIVLQLSPNAVSQRLRRARDRLRDALESTDSVGAGHGAVDPGPVTERSGQPHGRSIR